MIIRDIKLVNFRNFAEKRIDFSRFINVVFGFNGQGKTNLLEAISVACLSRSFRTRRDAELIRFGEEQFQINAEVEFDNGVEKTIEIQYSQDHGKRIRVDGERISSIIDFFGSFPIVILAPEDDAITIGIPAQRRSFLNFVLSLLDKKYLGLLQDLQRTLKQRNYILQQAGESRYQFSQKIEPWNEAFFRVGTQITQMRRQFLDEFKKDVQQIYQSLSGEKETLDIQYQPSFQPKWDTYEKFQSVLSKIANKEIQRGVSLIGPQRDEIVFLINGQDLRKFGSRGQHRTVLLTLKIGVYNLLLRRRGESPIFLLDDVYSEIDDVREKAFNDYFLQLKQLFITTHNRDIQFFLPPDYNKEIRYLLVENSTIKTNVDLAEE